MRNGGLKRKKGAICSDSSILSYPFNISLCGCVCLYLPAGRRIALHGEEQDVEGGRGFFHRDVGDRHHVKRAAERLDLE